MDTIFFVWLRRTVSSSHPEYELLTLTSMAARVKLFKAIGISRRFFHFG